MTHTGQAAISISTTIRRNPCLKTPIADDSKLETLLAGRAAVFTGLSLPLCLPKQQLRPSQVDSNHVP